MAGLLTANELTLMRAQASAMLPGTCTIQTRSTASDGMGGVTESWSNTYTSIACKLDIAPRQATFPQQGDQFQAHSSWVLTVAFDQAIAAGNRAIIGGDTFEVLNVGDDADYRTLRRAELKRID
jgi:head-tail adaptor